MVTRTTLELSEYNFNYSAVFILDKFNVTNSFFNYVLKNKL